MSSEEITYDIIVVGAGIIGLFTSYTMSRKGLSVLLIDQFVLPHQRGSSGGHSRLYHVFRQEELLIQMMRESSTLWNELGKQTGEELMTQTGMLHICDGEAGRHQVNQTHNLLSHHNVKHEVLDSHQMSLRYPAMKFDPNSCGLFQPEGGCLNVARCNRILLDEFLRHGGKLRDGEKVSAVIPGDILTVVTSGGRYKGRQTVLAPGPWARDLLLGLGLDIPFKTYPAQPSFHKVKNVAMSNTSIPVFLHNLQVKEGYQFIYGIPDVDYPGLIKFGTRGEPFLMEGHPDERDRDSLSYTLATVSEYIQQNLPTVEARPSILEPCVYTRTPDGKFVIDRHPQHPNILIGAGGSGLGYMMAPVIGKLLTEMATNEQTSYDLRPFRAARFKPSSKV